MTYIINNISLMGYIPSYSIGGGSLVGFCNTSGSILSTSSIIGDKAIRSAASNRLSLKSGTASAAIYIDQNNNGVLDNPSTCLSTLNVSGYTTLTSTATCLSSFNISGPIVFSNTLNP